MEIRLSQSVRMEQRLLQSPQMIQAMQILQLSALDLGERIEQELLENPLLERKDRPAPEAARAEPGEGARPLSARDAARERHERDAWDPGRLRRVRGDGLPDKKHEAMQNTPASYHSLGDSLLGSIGLIELDDRQREMIEYLVFSLDARGYLTQPLARIAEECGIEGANEEELTILLLELRHATHPALGAADLRECLLLQVDELAGEHPLLRHIVEEHLEDVAVNRIPRIARATGRSVEDVGQAVELLRTLEPCPGSAYGEAQAETVRPEIAVEEVDGAFQVRLTRDVGPELGISGSYTALMKDAPRGDPARKWIRQRLEAARWFIDALGQRQSTLLRVARAVFERQAAFLQEGKQELNPLRMSEVADVTGVHISTVSRAVAGKYCQTPHGILPLRWFFSGGTERASGGVASQHSIQQRVKELVEEEDPSRPRSDERLAELLRKRDGIGVARRTITKYRKVLGIPSSNQRRVF